MEVLSSEYIESMLLTRFNKILSALPSQCTVCHTWPAESICEDCIERFGQPRPRCRTCAMPVPEDMAQCGACLTQPPPLERCLAAVSYGYPWAGVIGRYKFREQPGLADALALLVRSTPWVEPTLEAADAVIPMPLSNHRLRHRGFNQALLLARRLAPSKTDSSLLLRIKDTPPQSSLKRAERLASVTHAFKVDPQRRAAVRNAHLVLIDDVMTSGASLFSAAQALRQAGAAQVCAIVIARTE